LPDVAVYFNLTKAYGLNREHDLNNGNSLRRRARMSILRNTVLAFLAVVGGTGTATAQEETHAKGVELLTHAEYLRIPRAAQPVGGKLPGSATLENEFPAAGDQGRLLSCTAWATTYNKAYRIFLASGRAGSPNNYVQSPGFIYSALTHEHCNIGIPIPTALHFLKLNGSIAWSSLPYSDDECPSWGKYRHDAKFNSTGAYRLSDDPGVALGEIRNLIVSGTPVIAAIQACAEFEHPTGLIDHMFGDDDVSCSPHAVLIAGYDDSKKVRAVRILNSWGETWGDAGKVWMTYDVFKKRLAEAYVDFGPGEETAEDLEALAGGSIKVGAAQRAPTLTAEILKKGLRSNIDPKILARFGPINGEPVNVSIWSIWLNLPSEYAAQIKSVDYYFQHPTFKHNPQRSFPGSTVFLAEWRGYGCVDEAYLIAKLMDGRSIRSNFNFCEVAKTEKVH
jgi:hypothetical protein